MVFNLFKRKDEADRASDMRELEIYSGMRVMVEDQEGRMLFVAGLQDPQRNKARLYQYSASETDGETERKTGTEDISVKVRGYNDCERKAVFMEGTMSPAGKHIWQLKDLAITRIENERAFNRLSTDIDATVIAADGANEGEKSCKLLNISIGGVSIGSEYRYYKGDRFLLRARLLEDRPVSVMYCEVLRVVEKAVSRYEYGCRFLELNEADQEEIIQMGTR